MAEKQIEETIEALIDKHGLAAVTHALSCVCAQKADHIRETWQDLRLAQTWQRASGQAERLADTYRTESVVFTK